MSKSFDPKKISGQLAIPLEDFEASFKELKRGGLIFTYAETPEEFSKKKFPLRMVGKPPVNPDNPSVVSLGPFAIKRETYEQAKKEINNPDTFKAYLGFLRLVFEKTGGAVEGYRLEATEEKLDEFISTIDFWDTENPVICEFYVWILPNEKCRKFVENITGKRFRKDDFSWWNTNIELGEGFTPSTINDYPEQYGAIPNDLIDKWARYLPTAAWHTAMFLYQRITRNNNSDFTFENIDQLLSGLKEGIDKSGAKIGKTNDILVDRELLAKELCDFNSLTYPTSEATMLEFLQQIGFILIFQSRGKVVYSLTKHLPRPKKVLKISKQWEEKMDKFVSSGTILFAYLNIDEITDLKN